MSKSSNVYRIVSFCIPLVVASPSHTSFNFSATERNRTPAWPYYSVPSLPLTMTGSHIECTSRSAPSVFEAPSPPPDSLVYLMSFNTEDGIASTQPGCSSSQCATRASLLSTLEHVLGLVEVSSFEQSVSGRRQNQLLRPQGASVQVMENGLIFQNQWRGDESWCILYKTMSRKTR